MVDNELIKIGIALDYPINWTIETVMRELVQNFYDAIGEERFGKDFKINVRRNKEFVDVVMETKGNSFSYEWLNYVGGSTKTDHPGKYVGMYGEGFKMCMLSLENLGCRMCRMESENWTITPCIYDELVSGTVVKMLGYIYNTREDDGCTRLSMQIDSLGCINDEDDILYEFFYTNNKLFGEFVVKNEKIVIYKRSNIECPSKYFDRDFKGVLYVNGLARSRLNIPLLINLRMDMSGIDTRGRNELYSFEANRVITYLTRKMDSRTSYYFLLAMYDRWNDAPNGCYDVDTWYYCICNLVRNVAANKRYAGMFRKKYHDMYYIGRFGTNQRVNKKIRAVRAYAESCGYDKWNDLNSIFRLLGARSLMDEYDNNKQFLCRKCNEAESKRVKILFNALEIMYEPGVLYDERPEILFPCRTDGMKGSINFDPLQFADADYSTKNRRKYNIRKLVIKNEELLTDSFMIALIKLFDLLIYGFCGRKSNKRAYMLTDFGERIIKKRNIINSVSRGWTKNAGSIRQ